jgi:tetratricopeptide (TPR) repeat protein
MYSLLSALRTWFDRRRAIRELRTAEIRDSVEFRPIFTTEINLARRLFNQGDREQALRIWRQMRARFPGLTAISEAALSLAIDLRYYDEAEAMMQAGLRYDPSRKAFFAAGLARIAQHRGNLDEAIRRCKKLLRKFPTAADGYNIAATCLNELGHQVEADAILARGVSKLPNDFTTNAHYAQQAMHRCAWEEALLRWEVMQGHFEKIAVPLGIARCLNELDRLSDAEKVLMEAGVRYGESSALLAALADFAMEAGDFERAVQFWNNLVRRFPSLAAGYIKGARALREVKREAEADELLCAAVIRLEENLAVHLEYARNAHRRGDWAVAAERWALVRNRFPACVEACQQELKALSAAEATR